MRQGETTLVSSAELATLRRVAQLAHCLLPLLRFGLTTLAGRKVQGVVVDGKAFFDLGKALGDWKRGVAPDPDPQETEGGSEDTHPPAPTPEQVHESPVTQETHSVDEYVADVVAAPPAPPPECLCMAPGMPKCPVHEPRR